MADVKNHHYDAILAPHITEKATLVAEDGKYIFKVAIDANKAAIKDAVEALFKVKVSKVNTIKVKGKTKRFRGTMGRRPDWKKAIVTLEGDQALDVTTGL
ncbi:MAG: 50S ribosomal protein L23 [Pseudomonadota bacterium]